MSASLDAWSCPRVTRYLIAIALVALCAVAAPSASASATGVSFGEERGEGPLYTSGDKNYLIFPVVSCNPPSGEAGCNPDISASFTPTTLESSQQAETTQFASGSASIPAGQSQKVALPITPEGRAAAQAVFDMPELLRQRADALRRTAAQLMKKAKRAETPEQAKKLKRKANKRLRTARRLDDEATAWVRRPQGTLTVTITHPASGATDTATFDLPR